MASPQTNADDLSLVYGPTDVRLWEKTIATLLSEQAERFGDKTAVVVPWQNVRLTYNDLVLRSAAVARAILAQGLQPGDRVGIFAGNRYEYLEVFLGASQIGCLVVVLNNTYNPQELARALSQSSCKLLFIATSLKSKSLGEHINVALESAKRNPVLKSLGVVTFGTLPQDIDASQLRSYDTFAAVRPGSRDLESTARITSQVKDTDIVNLQFTSGTTGTPKAAMLTHRNIVNNARFVGARLGLTPSSIVCCPPPLFHCFGLVLGFLASLAHGSAVVFPADAFDAAATLAALERERCDVLLGVPTMFLAALDQREDKRRGGAIEVRAALAAGSLVPVPLVRRLRREMGVRHVVVAYGMTETSPVTFMTTAVREDGGGDDGDDYDDERQLGTLGTVMPHTAAKVVDARGRTVPRGARGELCTSGYALMRGYLDNAAATAEAMRADAGGTVWMHTGDECVIDAAGLCRITGRIKDIIIRGGENIFPAEIEERLLAHPMVSEACVVGIRDERYGEVVGCFLRSARPGERAEKAELQDWVKQSLGRHKAPQWVFWIGDPAVGDDYPKTGSGKHQKHILRALGNNLIGAQPTKARL